MSAKKEGSEFNYDVCFSFSGEDRAYVEEVARLAAAKGVRAFYDRYEQVGLWGKDLYSHLDYVYRKAARYCVLFASRKYSEKLWTNHERRSAQARAIEENREYILPARFDDTDIPGLPSTVGYIDLKATSPTQLADLIAAKVGTAVRKSYLPPEPDRLYKRLKVSSPKKKEKIYGQALVILNKLKRTSEIERRVLRAIAAYSCKAELPDNVHVAIDLLRRHIEVPVAEILELVGGLRSLGVTGRTYEDPVEAGELGSDQMLAITWRINMDGPLGGNVTRLAMAMLSGAQEGYCEEHAIKAVVDLNFEQLSSATTRQDEHVDDAKTS